MAWFGGVKTCGGRGGVVVGERGIEVGGTVRRAREREATAGGKERER